MKNLTKRLTLFILCAAMLFSVVPQPAAAAAEGAPVQVENMSIGAGAAFNTPLIDPTDSNNFVVLSDMNDVYYSLDSGKSWGRTETMTNFWNACFSDNGTLYVGGSGLYASTDKGQTLSAIYPREADIRAISSRNGRNNQIILADGYDGEYVTCMDTWGDRVWFITLDWTTARTFQLLSCKADGTDLQKHLVYPTYQSASPQDVDYLLLATENGLYFSDGTIIRFYDFATGLMLPVYYADGKILDLELIDGYIFILDDTATRTKILYSKDLVSFRDLSDYNTLPNTFERYGYAQYFQWHFKAISGNDLDSIFLSFYSPVQWSGAPIGDLGGVMKFDGKQFHWVFDPVFQNRGQYDMQGWSFGSYDPINGICIDPGDDDHCIMANIDTVYDIHFGEDRQDVQYLHCQVKVIDGVKYYASTGLDAQNTSFVRVDPFDDQHILIPTSDLGLQISVDGGESFRRMTMDPAYSNLYIACYDVYFDESTPGLVYGLWSDRHDAPYIPSASDANAKGRFGISRDGGVNWDFTYSTGLPENSIPIRMSVRPNGDALIFAVATYNNGFFISYDSGRTFTSVSSQMDSYNGLIWGQDVVLTEDYLYCLTAWHTYGGTTPSVLYKIDLDTGDTTRVDLGKVINARSLTYDETYGLYLNAIHNTNWGWREDLQTKFDVNTDGGVYRIHADDSLTCLLEVELGVSSSGFTSDGTMYVVADKGMVYVKSPGEANFRLYVDGLFTRMLNVTFSPNGDTLYITTLGGGTYRMPAQKADNSHQPGRQTYTVVFRDHDGTILSRQEVVKGQAAKLPAAPSRKPDMDCCYTFLGWDTDTAEVVSDLVVTAQYEARAHKGVRENAIPATCQQEGYSGDLCCQYCHTLLEQGRVIARQPHAYGLPTYNGDGTHSVVCAVCGLQSGRELCFVRDGHCTACGHSHEGPSIGKDSQKFRTTKTLLNGKTYLLVNGGYTFGQSLKPEVVKLQNWLDGTLISNDISQDMLWTYQNGLLYTVHRGRVFYLTILKNRNTYTPALISDASAAVHWSYVNGGLCTIVLENGRASTRYLAVTSNGIAVVTKVSALTLCELQS